ncbi:MAG: hypothetical protein K2H91_12770 [Lachnospiraceae bacterium]|nr:hypothetical protein [Lachnospiraceae bacterium]
MIFKELKENNGWMMAEYSATWIYGYDFMLDAAQTIIDTDFQDRLQRVAAAEIAGARDMEKTDEVRANGNILRDCQSVCEECGVLTVSGISSIMECPVQFVFFNQTNLVRLFCPFKQYFKEHGEHVFDNYMNSIEIKAYCKDTERRTVEKFFGK